MNDIVIVEKLGDRYYLLGFSDSFDIDTKFSIYQDIVSETTDGAGKVIQIESSKIDINSLYNGNLRYK